MVHRSTAGEYVPLITFTGAGGRAAFVRMFSADPELDGWRTMLLRALDDGATVQVLSDGDWLISWP